MPRVFRFLSVLFLLIIGSSCASIHYHRLDRSALVRPSPTTPPGEPQFERGKNNVILDSFGWVVGIPSKIILLNRRLDNHRVGIVTEDALRVYLEYNGLADVKVRVNQYAPHREFRRLFRNKEAGWGWRYSLGVFSCLYQALLPGRIFGGDNYNPYTDTISLYSDVSAVALHEGGRAKDFSGQKLKGTYAVAYLIPVFTVYAEACASADAMSYIYAYGSAEQEKEAYRILFPAMGTYIGGMFSAGQGPLSPWYYAGVVPGHVIGRFQAADVDEQRAWRPTTNHNFVNPEK
jgi:hypothetical protein